jgi:murein DD-endopeptidase MepM/ murein hydrolase activator NlpD
MPFPLDFVPQLDYKTGGRRFGAPRPSQQRPWRLHAGCDLIAPMGAKVYAVDDGYVTLGPYRMDDKASVYALEVHHGLFKVRYGEVRADTLVSVGSVVQAGQHIAYVGEWRMLHFEMYTNSESGPLYQPNRRPYSRRGDVVDPSIFLDMSILTEPPPP